MLSDKAARRIRCLRRRERMPKQAKVRLGIWQGRPFMRWDTKQPRFDDVVWKEKGVRIVTNVLAFPEIAKGTLRFDAEAVSRAFGPEDTLADYVVVAIE